MVRIFDVIASLALGLGNVMKAIGSLLVPKSDPTKYTKPAPKKFDRSYAVTLQKIRESGDRVADKILREKD